MANQTNASTPYDSYEDYLDYLDLIPVDERKLKANKYLIVITFWVSLAFFVMLLFLILLYMSWSGSSQVSTTHQAPRVTASPSPSASGDTPQAPPSLGGEPGSRARSPEQRLWPRAPPSLPQSAPQTTLLSSRNWPRMTTPTTSADIRNRQGKPPPGDRTSLSTLVNSNRPGHTIALAKPAYVQQEGHLGQAVLQEGHEYALSRACGTPSTGKQPSMVLISSAFYLQTYFLCSLWEG
uniref:Melanocortin 2 receptor accessory protein n=1 Tax=Ursus americanus TaxID=9643 RepID=A0A452R9S7_URSAM